MALMFDYIIENGTILDGSSNASYQMDLGIIGDRIAAMGELSQAEAGCRINAAGLYVAPGFIDGHTHADLQNWRKPINEIKLSQGVCTEIVGNCGFSPAPLNDTWAELWRDYIVNVIGRRDGQWPFRSFGQYLQLLETLPLGQNMGTLVGTGAIRAAVKGFDGGKLTRQELALVRDLAEEALAAGAFGISSGLIYTPDIYYDTEQLVEVVGALSRYQRPYVIHIRGEGDCLLSAIKESIQIAQKAEVPLHISHFKAMGKTAFGLLDQAIDLIRQAREQGMDITCDCYPYTAGATTLTALLPPQVLEGGVLAAARRLANPREKGQIKALLAKEGQGWDNTALSLGWDKVEIAAVREDAWRFAVGQRIDEIGVLLDIPADEVFCRILAENDCDVACFNHSMRQEDVDKITALPWAYIASDSIYVPEGATHPRVYGTFPRILKQALAGGVLPLPLAIAKITSMPAARFGLQDRGHLAIGNYADITVFDAKIEDKATFSQSCRQASGIHLVMVNGKIALQDGTLTRIPVGSVLRSQ